MREEVKILAVKSKELELGRALYNDPDILVFDEATSALDVETEKILSILFSLKSKKLLFLLRIEKNSLEICDKIFKIETARLQKLKIFLNCMVSNKLDKIKFCKNCVESNQRFMGSIQHLDTKDGIKQRNIA